MRTRPTLALAGSIHLPTATNTHTRAEPVERRCATQSSSIEMEGEVSVPIVPLAPGTPALPGSSSAPLPQAASRRSTISNKIRVRAELEQGGEKSAESSPGERGGLVCGS